MNLGSPLPRISHPINCPITIYLRKALTHTSFFPACQHVRRYLLLEREKRIRTGTRKKGVTLFKKSVIKREEFCAAKSKSLASALAVNLWGRFKLLPAVGAWRKAICWESESRRELSARIFALTSSKECAAPLSELRYVRRILIPGR
jgi:hypothetical protein